MFCGSECYRELIGKNTVRDWRILKMIDLHPNCTTNYIANNWQDNNAKVNSYGVSQILRIYAARGIITRNESDQNLYTYRISDAFRASNYTLGQAVKRKIKL
jgi:SLT domain-containing protein